MFLREWFFLLMLMKRRLPPSTYPRRAAYIAITSWRCLVVLASRQANGNAEPCGCSRWITNGSPSVSSTGKDYGLQQDFDRCSITSAWDCGGVLVLHFYRAFRYPGRLYIVSPSTTKKMIKAILPCNLSPELSEYAFCWGYKPTLVSPESIIGELNQEEEMSQGRRRTKDIFKPLKPLHEQEKRIGQAATLATVCLMEFLVDIMRRLPDNMQEVSKMLCEQYL